MLDAAKADGRRLNRHLDIGKQSPKPLGAEVLFEILLGLPITRYRTSPQTDREQWGRWNLQNIGDTGDNTSPPWLEYGLPNILPSKELHTFRHQSVPLVCLLLVLGLRFV